MASLEEKIAGLLNNTDAISESDLVALEEAEVIKTKGGTTITDDGEGDEDPEKKDGDEGEDDTDVSKDPGATKKEKAVVEEGVLDEGSAPGQTKSLEIGGDEAGAGKTAKIKAKLGTKDSFGTLKNTASADKQDDAGDNSKIKAKLNTKDSAHKIADGVTGSTVNADNARNNVVTNEHMEALFNGETLSEEFKIKAATIFEAAVEQAAQSQVEDLVEQYNAELDVIREETETQLNEAVEEAVNEVTNSVDEFLNLVVENWMTDNRVALEGGVKIELMNSFVDGMKNLFKEHYIEVPNEKLNIVEEQASEITELSTIAEDLITENTALKAELSKALAGLVFESVTISMTDIQKGKFKTLAENVEFIDTEDYSAKLKTLKESYFPTGHKAVQEDNEATTIVENDGSINKYVNALSQNIKF